MKTAVFTLHNPSRRKRAMLDHALLHNHLAYSKVLKSLAPLLKSLVADELQSRSREQNLPRHERGLLATNRKKAREDFLVKEITKVFAPLPICSAAKMRRSIPLSIIGQIESHLELHGKQDAVGFPTVQLLKSKVAPLEEAIQALVQSRTLEEETEAGIDLQRVAKTGRLRPLFFVGNHQTYGFLLLRKPDQNQYYIFLNLVPESSRFARLTKSEQRKPSSRCVQNLMNMRTGEIMSFRSRTGCLFPIEFGRDYHDADFLQKGKGSPLSAKLLKQGERYEVHVTFEFKAERIEPKTFLGVDRGIYNLASVAVIDDNGSFVERKNIDGLELRFVQKALERRGRDLQKRGKPFTGRTKIHAANEAVHKAANEIVSVATQHRAKVVMEDLTPITSRGKRRGRSNFNRVLNRSQYQKLQKVLAYKLAIAGISEPREIHASYTSQACPVCGNISKENRPKVAVGDGFRVHEFSCVTCGFADDADLNASRNIALKHMWRASLSPALRRTPLMEVPEHKSFSTFLRIRAERRGERACDRKVGSFGRVGLDAQYEDGEVAPSGNAVEPRSGSNTLAGKNTPTMQSAVSPSDGILPSPLNETKGPPDG